MRTESRRRRLRKPQRKSRAKKRGGKTPGAVPESHALGEEEPTPFADELVVQSDRGFDEWSERVEPDPEATPW